MWHRKLLLIFILLSLTCKAHAITNYCDQARGAWLLDETSGNAIDCTSNGFDLIDVNTVGSATGNFDGSRDLEYDNLEYFKIASSTSNFIFSTAMTLSAFINAESYLTSSTNYIMTMDGYYTGKRQYNFMLYDGYVKAHIYNTNYVSTTLTSTNRINTGTSTHIAFTFDASANLFTLYIDGVQDKQSSPGYSNLNSANGDFFSIGSRYDRNNNFLTAYNFDGWIDEALADNIAYDSTMINDLMDNGLYQVAGGGTVYNRLNNFKLNNFKIN